MDVNQRIAQDSTGRWWYTTDDREIDGGLIGPANCNGAQQYDQSFDPTLVGPFTSHADALEDLLR